MLILHPTELSSSRTQLLLLLYVIVDPCNVVNIVFMWVSLKLTILELSFERRFVWYYILAILVPCQIALRLNVMICA